MELIRVILVDNEEVFREGVAGLLKEQPHIEVVYQCGSGKEAVEKSKEMKPDVVLLDSQIPEDNVMEVARQISKSSVLTKVAMITRPGVEVSPFEVLEAGATACLAKSISAADLVRSIELISSGRIVISPLLAERLLDEITSRKKTKSAADTEAESKLSEREREIVKLIAGGATNKEMAEGLFISEGTVKVHVKNILNKLELRNRQQLAVYAVLRNWIPAITTE
jgi:DNA-binding NarL/FixJ family response regulator